MEIRSVHICFEVSDFKKALEFYLPLFQAGGFTKGWGDESTYVGYSLGFLTLFIGQAEKKRVNRLPPTGQEFVVTDHVGVSLGTRQEVEAIAAAMLKAGIKPLFPAQEYPEFGPGFFAVTFCDPDQNVLEFCHRAVPAGNVPPK